MLRLYLKVDSEELATEFYFKKKETAEMWVKHHYAVISQLVWLLKKTRDFETEIRRMY